MRAHGALKLPLPSNETQSALRFLLLLQTAFTRFALRELGAPRFLVSLAFKRVGLGGNQTQALCAKNINRSQSSLSAQVDPIMERLSVRFGTTAAKDRVLLFNSSLMEHSTTFRHRDCPCYLGLFTSWRRQRRDPSSPRSSCTWHRPRHLSIREKEVCQRNSGSRT